MNKRKLLIIALLFTMLLSGCAVNKQQDVYISLAILEPMHKTLRKTESAAYRANIQMEKLYALETIRTCYKPEYLRCNLISNPSYGKELMRDDSMELIKLERHACDEKTPDDYRKSIFYDAINKYKVLDSLQYCYNFENFYQCLKSSLLSEGKVTLQSWYAPDSFERKFDIHLCDAVGELSYFTSTPVKKEFNQFLSKVDKLHFNKGKNCPWKK